MAKRLQIGARDVRNWDRDFKPSKGLQIGTEKHISLYRCPCRSSKFLENTNKGV